MITSVDTSVILDVLVGDPQFGSVSETALRRAQAEGKMVVCECVVAEVFPALDDTDRFKEFLADWHLEYSPMDIESSMLAGQFFSAYLSRGGKIKRIAPDFLIGAQAAESADRLLARDRGYLRDYFLSLEIWDPTQA